MLKRLSDFDENLSENSLYDASKKAAFVADKNKIADAFLFNFFGTIGLINAAVKDRGKRKVLQYLKTDKSMRISNIDDTNHDSSLSVKLAKDAGFFKKDETVNQITRFLAKVKAGQIDSIDNSIILGWADELDFSFHSNLSPQLKKVYLSWKSSKGGLDISYLTVKLKTKANKFAEVSGEFRGLAKIMQTAERQVNNTATPLPTGQQVVTNPAISGSPAQTPAAPTPTAPIKPQGFAARTGTRLPVGSATPSQPATVPPPAPIQPAPPIVKGPNAVDVPTPGIVAPAKKYKVFVSLEEMKKYLTTDVRNSIRLRQAFKDLSTDIENWQDNSVLTPLAKSLDNKEIRDIIKRAKNSEMLNSISGWYYSDYVDLSQGDFSISEFAKEAYLYTKELINVGTFGVRFEDTLVSLMRHTGSSSYRKEFWKAFYKASSDNNDDEVIDGLAYLTNHYSSTITDPARLVVHETGVGNSIGYWKKVFYRGHGIDVIAQRISLYLEENNLDPKDKKFADMISDAMFAVKGTSFDRINYSSSGISKLRYAREKDLARINTPELTAHVAEYVGTNDSKKIEKFFNTGGFQNTTMWQHPEAAEAISKFLKDPKTVEILTDFWLSSTKLENTTEIVKSYKMAQVLPEIREKIIEKFRNADPLSLYVPRYLENSTDDYKRSVNQRKIDNIINYWEVMVPAYSDIRNKKTKDKQEYVDLFKNLNESLRDSFFRTSTSFLQNNVNDSNKEEAKVMVSAAFQFFDENPMGDNENSMFNHIEYSGFLENLSTEDNAKFIKNVANGKITKYTTENVKNNIRRRSEKRAMKSNLASAIIDIIDTYPDIVDEYFESQDSYIKNMIRSSFVGYDAVMESFDETEIKLFAKLDKERMKEVLKFNNFDLEEIAKSFKIRKKKNEKLSQFFKRVKVEIEKADKTGIMPKPQVTKKELDKTAKNVMTVDLVRRTYAGRHGRIYPRIVDSYDVTLSSEEYDAFKAAREAAGDNNVPFIPAFHGTGGIAASMILRFGFRVIPENDSSTTGRMLGSGIYFSNKIDKSLQYVGNSGYGRAVGTRGYIFDMEAVLGEYGKDYQSAGTGNNDGIRSPEWAVRNGRKQLKILRVHEVEIINDSQFEDIKQSVQNIGESKKLKFKNYLKESVHSRNLDAVTYFFHLDRFPVFNSETNEFDIVDVEDLENVELPEHMFVTQGANATEVTFYNSDGRNEMHDIYYPLNMTKKQREDYEKLYFAETEKEKDAEI